MHMAPFDGAIDWEQIAKDLAATAYGREKLCVEPGGVVHALKPGKTAAQLRETYKDFAIIDDRHPRRDEDMLGKNVSVSQAINKPTPKGRGKKNKRR